MTGKYSFHRRFLFRSLFLLIILSTIVSCSSINPTAAPLPTNTPSPKPEYAEVEFLVQTPPKTPSGQFATIDILDEVTGLALNPLHFALVPTEPGHYSWKVPVPIGSLVKYRYGRDSNPPAIEYTAAGNQVRYRMIHITGPMTIQDTIFAWNDMPYEGEVGRINGQVLESSSNAPVPNALVTIAGAQVLTGSDGTFLIENIPTGTHSLTIADLDGRYRPYQQGATIAADSTTPAKVSLDKLPMVRITFLARPSSDGAKGIPLRMVGNTLGLGNTFADLGGGISTLSSRAPLMTLQEDGRYKLVLDLPAGMDLRYKYTLGDGFWNGELTTNAQFRIRQMIVPSKDSTIEDTIDAWQDKDWAPVKFNLKVANLPPGENVSIQFNPYGWTEPLPMWPTGNGEWFYILYNPLSLLDDVQYRYCRNDQCGITDEQPNEQVNSRVFTPSSKPQTENDEVKNWAWWEKSSDQTVIVAPSVIPKSPFVAGVEFMPRYRPSWQSYLSQSIQAVTDINANWVFLTPSWTYISINPPVLAPVAGKDPFWEDLLQAAQLVKDNHANLAIFPNSDIGSNLQGWWEKAQKDPGWWQSWFDRYQTFILHHADLAQQVGAQALVLGEPGIQAALPGITSNLNIQAFLPADAEVRWKQLILEVRNRFKGEIIWAVPYQGENSKGSSFQVPAYIDIDRIYCLFDASLENKNNDLPGLTTRIADLLDKDIHPVVQALAKPLIIGIDYASVQGAEKGCISSDTTCPPFSLLDPPYTEDISNKVDLQIQADIYNAFFTVQNDRPWITGLVSRRYYPPADLQDKSSSIHGKPAADVVWFWFSQIQKTK